MRLGIDNLAAVPYSINTGCPTKAYAIYDSPLPKIHSTMTNYPFSEEGMNQVLRDLDPVELRKYDDIQKKLKSVNINENQKYQDIFTHYYCIDKVHRPYLEECFKIIQQSNSNHIKHDDISFGDTLRRIVGKTRVDSENQPFLCFLCSNILHTLFPEYWPVWGDKTLKHFGLDKDIVKIDYDGNIDFEAYNNIYLSLTRKSHNEIKKEKFKKWKAKFNNHPDFNEFNFSDIKILDLFFWKYQHHDNINTLNLKKDIKNHVKNNKHVGRALIMLRFALLIYIRIKYKNIKETESESWYEIRNVCIELFKGLDFVVNKSNNSVDVIYKKKKERYYYLIRKYQNIDSDARDQKIEYTDLYSWDVMPLFELFELIEIWNSDKNYPDFAIKFNNRNKNNFYELREYRNNWAHQNYFDSDECKETFKFIFDLFRIRLFSQKIASIKEVEKILRNYYKKHVKNIT